jgi:hypothetical protein
MKTETEDTEILENFSDRLSLLKANSKLINQLQKRVTSTRFRVQDGDSVRLACIRALTNLILAQNTILKEVELDNLAKELEEIRELIRNQAGDHGSMNGR